MRTILVPAILLVPTVAHADDVVSKVDISFAAGAHLFSKNSELGVEDFMDEPGPSSSGLLGGRVAYSFIKRLAAEAEIMLIPTEDDVVGDRAAVFGFHAHLRFDLLTGKIRPFLVAGYGVQMISGGAPQLDDDADQCYHWGAGVRYAFNRRLDARIDLRHLIVPDRTASGATSDFEASAGVAIRFGGSKAEPRHVDVASAPPTPPPVPKPGDKDGDGLLDDVDRCVEQPEDKDGYEDTDGCIDPDNDKDGFVDQSDTCPNQAETKNGWQDDDGCPDEVIAELTGIGFERDSARIDSASTPLLERAYEILTKNQKLRVEISGHTSSEGNYEKNLELSLRRAEAVKTYLVRRGIAEERLSTVGHGSDKPVADNKTQEGRTKNRRIEFRILRPDEF